MPPEEVPAEDKLKNRRRGLRSVVSRYVNEATNIIQSVQTDKFGDLPILSKRLREKLEELNLINEHLLDIVQEDNVESLYQDHNDFEYATERSIVKIETFYSSSTMTTPSAIQIPFIQQDHGHLTGKTFVNLPKLTLPKFDGSVLAWQNFWDCFESSVHQNSRLTNVNKFMYLKGQLTGVALAAISGFTATNDNYSHAVALLQDRFGQEHKLIGAYMKALLDIKKPAGSVPSIRAFYDEIQTHVRQLHALGKDSSSFGDFLIPIIIERLPEDVLRNITRINGSSRWTFDALIGGIAQELEILESCIPAGAAKSSDAEAGIFVAHGGKPKQPTTQKRQQYAHTDRKCGYYAESHSSVNCAKYTTVAERKNQIQAKKLCLNCLETMPKLPTA